MKRRDFLKSSAGSLIAAASSGYGISGFRNRKFNVLFIAIDDMNDWIGPLANHLPKAKTPSLDRLSEMGVNFTNAHCASPACHPSRVSVMTGVSPGRSGLIQNVFKSSGKPTWRENKVLKDTITLSQHFRNNGYTALGTGKLFHALQWWPGSECPAGDWDEYWPTAEKPIPQWQRPELVPDSEAGLTKGRPLGGASQLFGAHPLNIADEKTSDYKVVSWAVSKLNKKHNNPFFLGCGIFRPHIPWEVPKKYFDMYPLEDIQLPPHKKDDLKDAMSHGREHWHKWVLENDKWEEFIQGYLASISYSDAMLGKLLDGLEQSRYKDNTIIVLWADHGMHIGEKQNWEKFTLWEESTRVPFMWVVPGVTDAGSKCSSPVSLIDVYPTLCELTGLPVPKQCDGKNLTSLLKKPSDIRDAPAVTTYRFRKKIDGKTLVGASVRSHRWRYIYYNSGFEELYDHNNDENEFTNLANKPKYKVVKDRLKKWLPEFLK
ncbi:Arylsulfatase [Sedimentisphaera salicampi]|uniref:Arylsulfatase n=2 Tax=Sedimentisphaera salicampi TaxID=1941349 RepID=A0A1W6LKS4_9BACT|nr:Arylsulfatase [Sedimentisphaera salicampi]